MLVITVPHSTRKIMVQIIRKHLLYLCHCTSMSTKPPTHYDSLEVSPNATQNEIKTAYYKLSLQYHPDKNKSVSAKEKFQQISDAYEIVGSYTTRKQYDRQMQVKYGNFEVEKHKENWPVQPEIDMHISPKSKVYDFNTWTQMHYQKSFTIRQERLKVYSEYKQQDQKDSSASENYVLALIAGCIVVILWFIMPVIGNNDIPIAKDRGSK